MALTKRASQNPSQGSTHLLDLCPQLSKRTAATRACLHTLYSTGGSLHAPVAMAGVDLEGLKARLQRLGVSMSGPVARPADIRQHTTHTVSVSGRAQERSRADLGGPLHTRTQPCITMQGPSRLGPTLLCHCLTRRHTQVASKAPGQFIAQAKQHGQKSGPAHSAPPRAFPASPTAACASLCTQ